MLIEQQKLIAEGAGAVAVAAALFNKVDVKGKKVACLVSGGNIDVTILSRVISRGLLKTGRSADITIELVDKPGQLSDVSRIIAETGGNVVAVHHDRSGENTNVNGCYLHLVMETRDHAHILEIGNALTNQGYKIIGKRDDAYVKKVQKGSRSNRPYSQAIVNGNMLYTSGQI